MHLASLVEEFRQHAAEIAVVEHRGNRRFATTYGDLAQLAGRFAAELDRRGIAPGERVVLWGENSAAWIAAFFGCLLRGVLVAPLDAAGSPEFAGRVIADVAARVVVGDAKLLHGPEAATPTLLLGDLATTLPVEANFAVSSSVETNSPFQIVFTSGTTSEPKGIVHTHRNVLASLQAIEGELPKYRKYERWVHPLRFLHTLPLSHVFGQFMGLWIPALLAAEVHFTDQLEPSRMVALLRGQRISVLIAVPRIQQMLRDHLLRAFPGLQAQLEAAAGVAVWKRWWQFRRVHQALGLKFWAVISGGAALPEELETFWQLLGLALIQGYGMTETAALVSLNHPFKISRGTIGKVLPGREVRIADDGEILVRGEMLAQSTWQGGAMRPRETEWLATGDLASADESGDLRFLGRKGDAIVTAAGLNIHPADVEAALLKRPGVQAAVVVGCDLANGSEPVAAVIFAGSDAALEQEVAAANRELAEFQRVRRVLRWPQAQFPYTSTGKLLRRQVRQWACASLAGQTAATNGAGGNTGGDMLLNLIAEITGERPPKTSDPDRLRLVEDLHLDSLGRVQLQSALEQRLAVELPDDAATVGDIRKLLAVPQPGEPLRASERTASYVYPKWPWPWPVRLLRVGFLELAMRPLVWLLGAPRVMRTGELPAGPMLLIANHVTAYDGALVLYALPRRLRQHVAIAMSGEMLEDFRHGRKQGNALLDLLGPVAWLLITALFNVFPLPRQQGFRRSFAHAGEALDHGDSVMIFPEGTRSRDGRMHAFRQGIGLLAVESAVPVLPVALVGLGELTAAKQRWFRSGKLEVRVGKPIPVDAAAEPADVTARLELAVRELLGE